MAPIRHVKSSMSESVSNYWYSRIEKKKTVEPNKLIHTLNCSCPESNNYFGHVKRSTLEPGLLLDSRAAKSTF